jgi:hypothetical protein
MNQILVILDTLRQRLEQELARLPKVTGPSGPPDQLYVTGRLNRLLVEAEDEARRLKGRLHLDRAPAAGHRRRAEENQSGSGRAVCADDHQHDSLRKSCRDVESRRPGCESPSGWCSVKSGDCKEIRRRCYAEDAVTLFKKRAV